MDKRKNSIQNIIINDKSSNVITKQKTVRKHIEKLQKEVKGITDIDIYIYNNIDIKENAS